MFTTYPPVGLGGTSVVGTIMAPRYFSTHQNHRRYANTKAVELG